MECDICGKSVSFFSQDKYKVGEFSVCGDCVDEAQRIVKGEDADSIGEKSTQEGQPIQYSRDRKNTKVNATKFRTLNSFGNLYAGIGWFVVIIGSIGVLVGLLSDLRNDLVVLIGSVFLIMSGLGFVITGQVVKCFVAIENNTREIYQLLTSTLLDEQ